MPPKADPAQTQMIWPPQAYDGKTRFDVWQMQLDMYLADMDITESKKKSRVLLQHIGPVMLEKIIDWLSPASPQSSEYDDLLKLIKDKCTKKINIFALRVKFFNEKQQQGQTLEEYFAHMSSLYGQCKLDAMTADDFGVLAVLKGLASDETRQFLMTSTADKKKIADVQTLASNFEQGKAAAKVIKGDGSSTNSYSMNVVGKGYKCKWCGENHQPGKERCPANGKACSKCGKFDHFAKVCRSTSRRQQTNLVEEGRESLNGLYGLLTVSTNVDNAIPPSIVKAKLNGYTVIFQHDTGAAVTVISEKVWYTIGKPRIDPCSIKLESYNRKIPVIGQSKVLVQVGQQVKEQIVVVVPKGKSLLGRNWMKAFGNRLYETYNHGSDRDLCKKGVYKQKAISVYDPKDAAKSSSKSSGWQKKTAHMHVPMQGKEKQLSETDRNQSYKYFMKQNTGGEKVDQGTLTKSLKSRKAKLREVSFDKNNSKSLNFAFGGIDRDDRKFKFSVKRSKTTVAGSESYSLREGDKNGSKYKRC